MKYYTLNDGVKIPAIGMGTYKITDQETIEKVIEAGFENGYEYFDTAKLYENEKYIGKALKNAPVKRENYKIATKVWPDMFGEDLTKKSIDESLKNLGTDYIDVIFLHWYGKYFKEAYKVFLDYKRQGVIKTVAVSNFSINQMKELLEEFEKPAIDQLESHPNLQDNKTYQFLKEKNILQQAWSPIGRGRSSLLEQKVILDLANKYKKTPAQIVLRWNIERGLMVIPKSVNPSRIKENIDIFEISLSKEDMEKIKTLDKNKSYSHQPEEKEWLEEIGRK